MISAASPRGFKNIVSEGVIRDGEYNTNDNDLVSEFYTPILSLAKRYDRSTGSFSIAGIKALAKPLLPFMRNAVKSSIQRSTMRIVASHDISESDYDQISGGYQRRYNTPDEKLLAILESLKDSSDQELLRAVRNIGTMVQLGLLDFKIAIPAQKLCGIFHRKIGIFTDFDGNTITFEGSQNVSKSGDGSERNLEGLVAFCSDDPAIVKFKAGHIRFFDDLWEDRLQNVRVRPLDQYPRELLASYGVPLESILKEIEGTAPILRPPPRECQREAVLGWIQNGHRGILDMCTGSGKSRAALLALDSLREPPLAIIVTGNRIDLVNQWADNEITPMYGNSAHLVRVSSFHGTHEELERKLKAAIEDFKLGFYSKEGKRVFVISTIQSASQEWFRNATKRIDPSSLAIIIDEVHHAGAQGPTGEVLEIQSDYRIGLSATWRRYDDDENDILENYFQGRHSAIAYSYPLSRGIKDGVLSEYKYFVHAVPLEREDLAELRKRLTEYEEELRKIDSSLSIKRGDEMLGILPTAKLPRIIELRNRWRDTLGRAVAKTDVALQIVDKEAPNLRKCIIYCASKQHLDRTSILMGQRHYDLEPYDSDVPQDTRGRIRRRFEAPYEGHPIFIGAIKCLDEGIDLPALDSAILVASNRTEREWIQRRGRILRKYPGKEYSIIHDVVMLPYAKSNDAFQLTRQEVGYVEAELNRIESFAQDSLNRTEVLDQIHNLRELFGVAYPYLSS